RAARLRHRLADGAGDRRQHRGGADRLPQPGHHRPAAAEARRAGDDAVMIAALLPAAGHSRRMGRPKLLLPLGGRTVLDWTVAARVASPDKTVFVPTFAGRRGHPTLLAWSHVAGIRAYPAGLGLNTYLRQHPDATCEVPAATAEVLADLDTPEDYQRLLERWR